MIDFHGRLSDRTVYLRYFQRLKLARRTAHEALTRVCFVDYDREIALVAERRDAASGRRSIVAVASLTKLHRNRDGEVAVLVGDDYQRHGLGTELVRRLVTAARDERLERLVATTMAQNDGMCAVFRRLGFTLTIDPEDDLVEAALVL
jgi:acetyltransferase